jgi:hypothetical protein
MLQCLTEVCGPLLQYLTWGIGKSGKQLRSLEPVRCSWALMEAQQVEGDAIDYPGIAYMLVIKNQGILKIPELFSEVSFAPAILHLLEKITTFLFSKTTSY